jgi:hypothetical protein
MNTQMIHMTNEELNLLASKGVEGNTWALDRLCDEIKLAFVKKSPRSSEVLDFIETYGRDKEDILIGERGSKGLPRYVTDTCNDEDYSWHCGF